jgi:hypothetical protein
MALPTSPLHWRFLAHGPVQRQLVPHVLGVAAKGKAYTTLTPEEWVVLESRIAANISANSLLLDTETYRDGDCGLDATLRNLERLRPTNTPSQNIIRVLATKGRAKALQAMRLLACMWVRDNEETELVPQVTVAQWVAMEGAESVPSYIAAMRLPRVWIDTLVLVALSAVFEIQYVCFSPVPQLIVAPTLANCKELPVAIIANVANVHFYAVHPEPPPDPQDPPSEQEDDLLPCVDNAATPADDDTEPVEEACHRSNKNKDPQQKLATTTWATLCAEALQWQPFSSAPSHT